MVKLTSQTGDKMLMIVLETLRLNANASMTAAPNFTASKLDRKECRRALSEWTELWTKHASFRTTTYREHSTIVYETIEDVGKGSVYTACDGIPRFRFDALPTEQTTRRVTVERSGPVTRYFFNATAEKEFDNQFPKPCDIQDWDHANQTLMELCREEAWNLENRPRFNEAGDKLFDRGSGDGIVCGRWCYLDARAEVALIYWPPTLSERDVCAANGYGTAKRKAPEAHSGSPKVVTMDAITFQGQDLYRKTMDNDCAGSLCTRSIWTDSDLPTILPSVLKGPFTFTSPTVYLAHHPLSLTSMIDPIPSTGTAMSDFYSSSVLRSAGVVPLAANQIFSVRPGRPDFSKVAGVDYARLVAKGLYSPDFVEIQDDQLGIATFDFDHLQDPVPASVFYDARSQDCWGVLRQSHCATITDGSYRPQLVFKNEVWRSIVGEWYDCARPGLVDPPIALIPVTSLATPVLPGFATVQYQTQSAQDPEKLEANDARPGNVPADAASIPTNTARMSSAGGQSAERGSLDPATLVTQLGSSSEPTARPAAQSDRDQSREQVSTKADGKTGGVQLG
jgi:hypothetical protein